MALQLAGIDVSVQIGNFIVQFEEVSLSIDDKSATVMSRGRPNGHVRGAVSASGEITLDTANFQVMMDAAKFVDMANGDLDGRKAFLTRKLKVKGNIALAQKMQKFFPQG